MRSYLHLVDQGFLHGEFSGAWFQRFGEARSAFVADPSSVHLFTAAIDVYFEGIALAWALNSKDALGQLRQELSTVVDRSLRAATANDLQTHIGQRTFSRAGVGIDREVIGTLAGILRDRARRPEHDKDPEAYAEPLLDGLIALVLGEDVVAQRMATNLHEHLQHPRTPPSVRLDGMPHVIDAVARRDQAGLEDAATVATEAHVHQSAPTRTSPAGPATLFHPALNLACRSATWRGMQWPTSPYLLAVTDPPTPSPATAGAAK